MSFDPALFTWLDDLAQNNDRAWFTANKAGYERWVKGASFAFIRSLAPRVAALSPHIRVDEKALFRIYRDTRFSHDKRPYKTHVGLHFRHQLAGDVHTPGLYLHLEPSRPGAGGQEGMADGGCWFGAGLWMPDGPTLRRLRVHIDEHADRWRAITDQLVANGFVLSEDRLARVPAGFAKDHTAGDLLRLKSHTVMAPLPMEEVVGGDLVDAWMTRATLSAPLVALLCEALSLPF